LFLLLYMLKTKFLGKTKFGAAQPLNAPVATGLVSGSRYTHADFELCGV